MLSCGERESGCQKKGKKMIEIIGVRFKHGAKVYYFRPLGNKLKTGDKVIVHTARGVECGEVAMPNKIINEKDFTLQVKTIIRPATKNDLKQLERNQIREKEAFKVCNERIAARGLDMRLVDVEFMFDNDKILFYFTADLRVDFRELVKDLAAIFRTRIELRQIGVRDKAKLLGGLGICGREICCKTHLPEFDSVSIKMAKEQGISLNSSKISGTCGRLMCCLKNEQTVYDEMSKITPRVGSYIKFGNSKGYVMDANLLTGRLRVRPDGENTIDQTIDRADATVLREPKIVEE